jgi:hypothetical protein
MGEGLNSAPHFYEDVQATARRQFGVSIVVGIALLAAATFIGSRPAPLAPAAVAAHRLIVQPEARPSEVGRAADTDIGG